MAMVYLAVGGGRFGGRGEGVDYGFPFGFTGGNFGAGELYFYCVWFYENKVNAESVAERGAGGESGGALCHFDEVG